MRLVTVGICSIAVLVNFCLGQSGLTNQVQMALDQRFGPVYKVASTVALDCVGDNDQFEDPYGTLLHDALFLAVQIGDENHANGRGILGVFSNARIAWASEPVIECDELNSPYIYGTRDLNNDGIVEIITSWPEGMHQPLELFWIVAWTGESGHIVSEIDAGGKSVLKCQEGTFTIVDLNGDGIAEIQGLVPDFFGQTNRIATYCWNGSSYGLWPLLPEPPLGRSAPRDRLDFDISVLISHSASVYHYSYTIKNNPSSLQDIDEFNLVKRSNDLTASSPGVWEFGPWNDKPIAGWQSKPENRIRRGDTLVLFLTSIAPPSILLSYSQGYNYALDTTSRGIEELFWDVQYNSSRRSTVGPADLDTPLVPLHFVDTLASYTRRSRELAWITSQAIADKYLSLFNKARIRLERNDPEGTAAILRAVLQEIRTDSSSSLTSEAYALLWFNTEYLLEKIPLSTAPAIAALSPAMTLTGSGSFTLIVTGSNFTSDSRVLWNNSERSTTFISPDELRASVTAGDVARGGTATITVRQPGESPSNASSFEVVRSFPAPVDPVLDCVTVDSNRTYTAWFGYKNENTVPVYIPLGPKNMFSPSPQDRGQTRVFQSGRRVKAFRVVLDRRDLVWTLNGRTCTAVRNSPRCP